MQENKPISAKPPTIMLFCTTLVLAQKFRNRTLLGRFNMAGSLKNLSSPLPTIGGEGGGVGKRCVLLLPLLVEMKSWVEKWRLGVDLERLKLEEVCTKGFSD